MKKNLVLTGMMGVGKSTIGESLSVKLKMKFTDIDNLIESTEGTNIQKIFQFKGEEYFRNIEKKITLKVLQKAGHVISLGGGAFIDDEIRNIVLKKCASFWLDLDINLLIKRVSRTKKRPLLNIGDLNMAMNKIYTSRKSIYNLADYKISCNKISKPLIVEKILKIYEANRD